MHIPNNAINDSKITKMSQIWQQVNKNESIIGFAASYWI